MASERDPRDRPADKGSVDQFVIPTVYRCPLAAERSFHEYPRLTPRRGGHDNQTGNTREGRPARPI
jgi:hypothetical protein